MPDFLRTDSKNADFRALVSLLDADLRIRDGEEHAFYAPFNTVTDIPHVVVAHDNSRPVGCGAFKPYSEDAAEIKRMFVRPENRGQGIARRILMELEMWARELGYSACVLETGRKQPEAIALYRKSGYAIIPNYGQYVGVENSVCMRKSLEIVQSSS